MKVTLVRGRAIDPAVNKIAKTLSRNGHDVTLLVWDRRNTLKSTQGDGYTLHRFNLKAPYDSLWVVFFLPLWWSYEFFFLLAHRSEVIHACDLDTLPPAILVKLIKRNKLFYHIYDFYANNLPDGSLISLRKVVRTVVAAMEKFGIGFSDVLFLADEARKEEVTGACIKKIEYIYNSPPDYFPVAKSEQPDNTELVVFYAGVIAPLRGLGYMIDAVHGLAGVKLLLSGVGPDQKSVEEVSRQHNPRIQFLGWLPSYQEIINKTLAADVLFRFSDPKHPKTKYESPNKLFEAMMCAKPIIVTDGAAMSSIVRKENCGLVVPWGDVAALKEALLELKNSPELRHKLGQNGRRAYDERYGWPIMEKRLLKAYDEVMSNHKEG